MAHFLVTGGAGFIGSHIVDALVAGGHRVRVFDNYETGKRENLAHHGDAVEQIEGDLRDGDAVRRAVEGVDYVCHQAALGSVPRSVVDPVTSHDVNATGTLTVLLAAKEAGVKRVVYASSSSVYGDTPELPKHEGMTLAPKSPYAITKLTGEYYCRAFPSVYGLEAIALRYFNVFGPRQDPNSQYAAVIPLFVSALMRGERPSIFGDGLQSRDFTFIANVVSANLKAFTAPAEAVGQAYNIAAGDCITLLDLLAEIQRLMGIQIDPDFGPERAGDVRHSYASIELAKEYLGYTPLYSWQDGLKRTVAAYQSGSIAAC